MLTLRGIGRGLSGSVRRPALLSAKTREALSQEKACLYGPHRRQAATRGFANAAAAVAPPTLDDAKSEAGLAGIPGLRRPSDFAVLASAAMVESERLRGRVVRGESLQPVGLLRDLDAISNALCSVIDVAEFCRSVHADSAFREAAEETFAALSGYIQELNTDAHLHGALRRVTADPAAMAKLTAQQRRMATLLQAEFEADGIHLPEAERREVLALQNEIVRLETLFSINIVAKQATFEVDAAPLRGIPRRLLGGSGGGGAPSRGAAGPSDAGRATAAADAAAVTGCYRGKSVTLSTEAHVSNLVLKHVRDGAVRRQMYHMANTVARENVQVLEQLMAARDRLAKLLGFKSYAHRFTSSKMAGTPEVVKEFLRALADKVKAKAAGEMEELRRAKLEAEGDASLAAWDVPHYLGRVKADRCDLDGRVLAAYFPLEACLDGLALVCRSLFGIRLRQVPMMASEGWTPGDPAAVRKLLLEHPTEGGGPDGLVGTVYLDLHPRPGKYTHAAHFTLRCGCTTHNDGGDRESCSGMHQLPVVALVCNFSPPTASPSTVSGVGGISDGTSGGGGGTFDGGETSGSGGVCLLSHSELETLFHEFGHALHSLLSRTEFQHLSGTRAEADFVETPSHLMEYFAWDYRVVKQFARHYRTRELIPEEMMRNLNRSKALFAGIDAQIQILYAALDQELFGPQPEGGGTLSSTEVLARLQEEVTSIPHVEGTYLQARFGHLTGYGAGYYGYLYARSFASAIWHARFAADPLSAAAGARLWRELLAHGGAADPREMLRTLLDGRSPDVDSLLQEMDL